MSKRNLVNGYIVSDSIILYTNSNGEKELIELINLVDSICKKEFAEKGIKLNFLQANLKVYKQFKNEFVAGLSIIDVMMFNSKENVKEMLNDFELI